MRAKIEFDLIGKNDVDTKNICLHWQDVFCSAGMAAVRGTPDVELKPTTEPSPTNGMQQTIEMFKRAKFHIAPDPGKQKLKLLWEQTPSAARTYETPVMLGWDHVSQLEFVVSISLNPSHVFVRLNSTNFESLRKAVTVISRKLHDERRRDRRFPLKLSKRRRARDSQAAPGCYVAETYVELEPEIRVFEDKSSEPFLVGHYLKDKPAFEAARKNSENLTVAVFAIMVFVALFFGAPVLAKPIANTLGGWLALDDATERIKYVQGTLERIGSAFVITFAIAIFQFGVRVSDLRKKRPIAWGSNRFDDSLK